MPADSSSILTLVMFLLAGGGRDLVSYIPPDVYWNAKGVETVTVDAVLPDLAAIPQIDVPRAIGSLGSADPAEREAATRALLSAGPVALVPLQRETTSPDVEVSRRARALVTQIRVDAKPREVRRLMAMQALGALKDPKALPALRAWADSPEPFMAEYARAAIAQIEGQPAPPPATRDAKALAADVDLLPASCAAVLQVRPGPGLTPPFEDAIAKMELPEQTRENRVRLVGLDLVAAAERYGNLRVDAATVGLSGDFDGARRGFAVAVLRGRYDPDLAAVVARQERLAGAPVAGQVVFQSGPEVQVFFPSPDRVVLVASPDPQGAPVAEMVKAVGAGTGGFRTNAELAKLADVALAADPAQPVWAVAQPTAGQQQAFPFLDGVETLNLTSTQEGNRIDLKLSAAGRDAERLAAAARATEAALKEPLAGLETIAAFMPPLRPTRDLLRSVRFTPAGGTATGTATWQGSLTSLYVFDAYPYTLPVDAPKE